MHAQFDYSLIFSVCQITNMKARGLEFLTIPDSYYEQLREKLKSAKITVAEDLNTVSFNYCKVETLPLMFPRPIPSFQRSCMTRNGVWE